MKNILFAAVFFCFAIITTANAQTNIRAIDFSNFIYQPFCGEKQTQNYQVTNGTFFEETIISFTPDKKKKAEPETLVKRKYFKAFQTIYADINSDRNDEAIILTVCNKGGLENYSEGFIFGMKDGVPQLLARINGGDRALNGIRRVSVEDGLIRVERAKPGDSADACCAENIETARYNFENNALVEVGERIVREIYQPTEIQFPAGSNQTAFDLEISKDAEINRFTVSGRKGQTLRVSTTSEDARINLKKGKAQLESGMEKLNNLPSIAKNVLVAKLKETGEFVFEITNFSRTTLNVTVTVEIN